MMSTQESCFYNEGNILFYAGCLVDNELYYNEVSHYRLNKYNIVSKENEMIFELPYNKYLFAFTVNEYLYLVPYNYSEADILILNIHDNVIVKNLRVDDLNFVGKKIFSKPIIFHDKIVLQVEESDIFCIIDNISLDLITIELKEPCSDLNKIDFLYTNNKKIYGASLVNGLKMKIDVPEDDYNIHNATDMTVICPKNVNNLYSVIVYEYKNHCIMNYDYEITRTDAYGQYFGSALSENNTLWLIPMLGRTAIKIDLNQKKLLYIDLYKMLGRNCDRVFMKVYSNYSDRHFFISDNTNMPIICCQNDGVIIFDKPKRSLNEFIQSL